MILKDQSHLEHCAIEGVIAELKKQFNKEKFFQIFY